MCPGKTKSQRGRWEGTGGGREEGAERWEMPERVSLETTAPLDASCSAQKAQRPFQKWGSFFVVVPFFLIEVYS